MKYFAGLFLVLLSLSSCGFQPVYGERSLNSGGQAIPVSIGIIPDREGQIVRNELIDRMGTSSDPQAYSLKVFKIEETTKELAITKASEATRAQLRLNTQMVLKDPSGKQVLSREVQALTSYNILESEFATRVAAKAARENALRDLARQIDLYTHLYFDRK